MTRTTSLPALFFAALSFASCNHVDVSEGDIVLDGYEVSNYAALDGSLRVDACVIGRLSINTAGAYFALQPLESGTRANLAFSRINTDLADAYVERNNMKSERTYRICGAPKDTTPFRGCADNFCKWYVLKNAKLG